MNDELNASIEATVNEAGDQAIAQSINDGLKYVLLKDLLIKPLPIKQIEKVITTQVPTGAVGEDGCNEYEVEEETKKVDSDYMEGIVISIPPTLDRALLGYTIGDTVVFHRRVPAYFDLFKDSMLVKPYDIMAVVKK